MQRQVPSFGRILVMVTFVLSCFGLLLYLWVAFGGAIPFKAKGYRFKADFSEASQLAKEADVRISGVSVGKVKDLKLENGKAQVTMEVDTKYAPVPSDSRVMLRQKTLLGETYVELTPGSASVAKVPTGGTLPTANAAPSVALDQVLQTFDTPTRKAFQVWMQSQGAAVSNRGADLNDAFGYLPPFADSANTLLGILRSQSGQLTQLVSNGGTVFGALASHDGELTSLIANLNLIFRATAQRNRELAETFVVLPTFLNQSKLTVARLKNFANFADPIIKNQLRPIARELSPTLIATSKVSPDLAVVMDSLGGVISAGKKGLPALNDVLNEARPLLAQLYPFLRNLSPIVEWVSQYQQELTAFIANLAVATQATDVSSTGKTELQHYLHTLEVTNAENLAPAASGRLPTNRPNPYNQPDGLRKIGSPALQVFENRQCTGAGLPTLDPSTPTTPPELNEQIHTLILDLGPVAPPCDLQDNFTFQAQNLHYPHVNQAP